MIIGLIGNPNSGKTTLFNALTGARQKVGNWPGVTVERKSGYFACADNAIEVIDLPGVYTLSHFSRASIDEKITRDFILSGEADAFVNVVDASNLERHLYLTTQLLEMGVPVIVALNMMDMAEKRGIKLDMQQLSEKLGCPVIPLESHRGYGIEALKTRLSIYLECPLVHAIRPIYPEALTQAIEMLEHRLTESQPNLRNTNQSYYYAIRQLEEEACAPQWENLRQALEEELDVVIADSRYTWIHDVMQEVVSTTQTRQKAFTQKLDAIILNRFLGIPVFLSVIYLMFFIAIHVGGVFQDFFDGASDALCVQGVSYLLQLLHAPAWLTAILAMGVGKGINTTLTFIPVLAAMFFCLSFLESSGYMARAAFVMDRLMNFLGLPGKALVPMIIGFGCNVPAIMSARTLDNSRDRILTIMMSPFMSCSARLAIFSVFVTAFFPTGGQNVIFALYLIGILAAILTGWILQKTVLKGEPSVLVMELPSYHRPTLRALVLPAIYRTKHFLIRAGKVIIPVCMLLGGLNALTLQGQFSAGEANTHSLLSAFGQFFTPLFAPMGITSDNWPATVGLMTGTLAKEVVIATLNTLYSQTGELQKIITAAPDQAFSLLTALKEAVMTIPDNIAHLPEALAQPLLTGNEELSSGVYGLMYVQFGGAQAAFAYLLFVSLYVPCASTMAVIRKELNTRWMWFSIGWSTFLAYSAAVLYYQVITALHHPFSSLIWMMAIVFFYWIIFQKMRQIQYWQEG